MYDVLTLSRALLAAVLIVGALYTFVGLVGLIVSKVRQYKNRAQVVSMKKWWVRLFVGIVLWAIPTGLYIVYSYAPCQLGLCEEGIIIEEEKGKLIVSQKPEVQALVQKYGRAHVQIKASEIELVQHAAFIENIYPTLADDTGCIIVAHAGDEGFVYREDKQLNIVFQETLAEFKERTKHIDRELMIQFYLSLH